jgi:hypothetical protein
MKALFDLRGVEDIGVSDIRLQQRVKELESKPVRQNFPAYSEEDCLLRVRKCPNSLFQHGLAVPSVFQSLY